MSLFKKRNTYLIPVAFVAAAFSGLTSAQSYGANAGTTASGHGGMGHYNTEVRGPRSVDDNNPSNIGTHSAWQHSAGMAAPSSGYGNAGTTVSGPRSVEDTNPSNIGTQHSAWSYSARVTAPTSRSTRQVALPTSVNETGSGT